MIKELLLGVLVLNGTPGLVSAQETYSDMAVVDAFAECQAWTATGDTTFTDQWWAIVADEPFQDRQVSILISNKVPLFLSVDITYADTTDPQSEVLQRQCTVRLADTSVTAFSWVNGAVPIGDYWDNLAVLSPESVQQQLLVLQQEFGADPTLARIDDAEHANAMFASCSGEYALSFLIYPEWQGAGFGGWQASAYYSSTPPTADSQVQRTCDTLVLE